MTLREIASVYDSTADGQTIVHRVDHELFRVFSDRLGQLAKLVPPDDLRATQVVRWLKRFRFARSVTPVGFDHPLEHCLGRPPLESWRREMTLRYASSATLVDLMFSDLDKLLALPASPLEQECESVLLEAESDQRLGICVPAARYLACFDQALIKTARSIERRLVVVSQNQLRENRVFDRLILVGSPAWFRYNVFAAPRAPRLEIIQYAWIGHQIPQPTLPAESSVGSTSSRRVVSVVSWKTASPSATVEPVDYMVDESPQPAAHVNVGVVDTQGEDACLVTLETGHVVYISKEEDSRILVIDESSGETTLDRMSLEEIEPGMHLVLRTEGSADYLRDVADASIGRTAADLRQDQLKWKNVLRNKVLLYGATRVAKNLRDSGIAHATPANVDYWSSDRNIATRDIASFSSLLRYCGLGDQVERLWGQAETLRDAHWRAGGTIRQMLLDVLRKADLTDLRKRGRMDFRLDVQGAGVLSAFTVQSISPESERVSSRMIGKPIDRTMELPWQG